MAFSRQQAERHHVMKLKYRLRIFESHGDQDNIKKVKRRIEHEIKEYDIK